MKPSPSYARSLKDTIIWGIARDKLEEIETAIVPMLAAIQDPQARP